MSGWPVKPTPDVNPRLALKNKINAAYQCQLIFLGLRESNTTSILRTKKERVSYRDDVFLSLLICYSVQTSGTFCAIQRTKARFTSLGFS